MSKKIIIIISVILGLALLGLVGYYFYIQGQNPNTPNGITSVFKNFFPFGGPTPSEGLPVVGESPQPTPQAETPTPPKNFTQKLRKISAEEVAGSGTMDVKAGTIVRYIEKATGHIFEVELFSPNQNRISNTTIPLVYDAIWGNKNTSIIARYLKDDNQTIDTYSLILKNTSTSTENSISGIAFPRDISDVSIFGSSVFYLQQGADSSMGFVSNFDGSSKKQIWNSPIKEVLSQFVSSKTVALTTKPAKNIPGFLYFVDTSSGQIKSVISGVSGLSTLSDPDANQVLYLEEASDIQMYILDGKSGSSKTITPVTFPEKCVWSKNDKNIVYCAVPKEYINSDSLTLWYRGLSALSDSIWKYDIKNNTSSIVENLSIDSGESIDVMKPILSDNEQYLVFMNKIDNSLWSLDLTK